MIRYTFALLWGLVVFACASTTPEPDGAKRGASCASACTQLRYLSCEAAEPTGEGATCEEVCETVQKSGVIHWDLGCRSKAKTCEAIDACEAK